MGTLRSKGICRQRWKRGGTFSSPGTLLPFPKAKGGSRKGGQASVGMSCPVPADQGVAQAGLLDAEGVFLHLPHFSLAFCSFFQFLFMLALPFDT